jgi:hypothetical protein
MSLSAYTTRLKKPEQSASSQRQRKCVRGDVRQRLFAESAVERQGARLDPGQRDPQFPSVIKAISAHGALRRRTEQPRRIPKTLAGRLVLGIERSQTSDVDR